MPNLVAKQEKGCYFWMAFTLKKKEKTPVKNISQIEHTRHRSVWNFMVNILGALAAYCFQPKKPSLNLAANEKKLIIEMLLRQY